MAEKTIFSVRELTQYIKETLEADNILRNVWVRGEVSNFTHHASGHMYFTLKDEFSQLHCVMFRENNINLSFMPDNGLCVIAYGYITVFEKRGQYQLCVEALKPDGLGALHLAFEKLKEKLSAEGLFDPSRKRPIPKYPKRVAIITSENSAAFHDLVTIMRQRFPSLDILFIPAIVQGIEAPGSIIRAISLLNRLADVDVAVLSRGGGSLEELWAFNEESVARAIFAARVPVVTAIGHETDYTIADFVADRRAPTPSAAAQLIAPDRVELSRFLASLNLRLENALTKRVQFLRGRLQALQERKAFKYPKERMRQYRQFVDELVQGLKLQMDNQVKSKRGILSSLTEKLKYISPLNILERGYSITRKLPERKIVRSIGDVLAGDKAEVIVSDGTLLCEVEGTTKKL